MLNFLLIGKKKECFLFLKKVLRIRNISFYKFDLRVFFFQKKRRCVRIFLINLEKMNLEYIEKKKDILKINYILYISNSYTDFLKENHSFFLKNNIKVLVIKEFFKNYKNKNFFFIKYNPLGFLFLIKEIKKVKKKKKKDKNYIPILGFKNVGKTTLINSICKKKIFITSKKPGNTKRISTFYKEKKDNILFFFDFPGFKKKIKIYKLRIIENFYKKIKIVLFLVSLKPNKREKRMIEKLGKKFIVIICINKIDIKKKIIQERIYKRFLNCKISAKKKTNIRKLMFLIKKTISFLKKKFLIKKKNILIKKEVGKKISIEVGKRTKKRDISRFLKIKENMFNIIYSRPDSNR
ncbi:GTPase Era [Candidatus Vidania fulgoroideae]|nr:GTPase Era [Candidatus Vidania fulgoroideae]